jgi:hypothetical protein
LNYLICEGKYDLVFFEELINKKLKMTCCPVNSNMKELQKIFGSSSDYYNVTFNWVIYKDNGKDEIKKIVLPRLIIDNHGKSNKIHFLVVLDDDYQEHNEIIESFYSKVVEIINGKNVPNFTSDVSSEKQCITTKNTRNDQCIIFFKFFMVPTSLDKIIVDKTLEKFPTDFSANEKEILRRDDPHESLKKISKKIDLSKDKIIQESVIFDWFIEDSWYQQLNKILQTWNT